MRRHLDIVVGVVAVLVAIVALVTVEAGRADRGRALYGEVVASAGAHVETWLDAQVARQRAIAFTQPDGDELAAVFGTGHVSFALLLDGDGRILATHPERPDIGPGDDLSGRFPHIDAVLGGASTGFWASDAATTASGSVAAVAVAGPGEPATVLTTAFDLVDTLLPRTLVDSLVVVEGARWTIRDDGTGVRLAAGPGTAVDNAREVPVGPWVLRVTASDAAVAELAGGTASWPGRVVVVGLAAVVVLVLVRRRRAPAPVLGGGLFEASAVPAMVVDVEADRIVQANAALAQLTGRSATSLEGQPTSTVLVVDDDDRWIDDGRAAVERRVWAEGEQRWARVTARTLPDPGPDGAERSLVEVVDVDADHRKRAVLERQQVVLRDLAGRLSHDLRTPLTAMVGFADLLERMPDADLDQRVTWASRLTTNARQLSEYVRDMADAAAELARRPATDVRACAQRALHLHEASLRSVGAEVVDEIPADLAVAMPELLLRQVLANLVDNAVKYRNRAVTLRLVLTGRRVGSRAEIAVSDNGPGVPAPDRDRIFDDGTRTSSDRIAGTGLGLAMSRDLVGDAGGTIHVEDAEPTGARFVLRLPVAPTVADPTGVAPSAVDDGTSEEPTGGERAASGIDAAVLDRYRPDEVLVRHSSGGIVHLSPPDGLLARLVGGGASATGERLHPDDAASVVGAFQAATADPGQPHDVVARFRSLEDGEWVPLLLTCTQPLPEHDLGGLVVSARPLPDVDGTSSLFEELPFPALLLGHHRQLLRANDAAVTRFGWEDGLPVHAWLDDVGDDVVRTMIQQALVERATTTWHDDATVGVVTRLTGEDSADAFLVLLAEGVPQGPVAFDDLTGLPDPAAVRANLVRLLAAPHDERVVAVAVLALGGLAEIRAERGQAAADAVQQALADRLRTTNPGTDTVTRRQDGEFVVVLDSLPAVGDVRRAVDRIRAHLQTPVLLPGGETVRPRVAIGTAVVAPGQHADPDLVLIAAEQAAGDARIGQGTRVVQLDPGR